jgi:hypothetical protein
MSARLIVLNGPARPRQPARASRRQFLAAASSLVLSAAGRGSPQDVYGAGELAAYRLSDPVFSRFAHATRLIAAAMRQDPRFETDPLFTREIAVSGDAPAMASRLKQRLDAEPALASALFAADIGAREYALFALALFAARLAQGFVKSGAMRRVPAGVATENVAFVTAREQEISSLLKTLHLE